MCTLTQTDLKCKCKARWIHKVPYHVIPFARLSGKGTLQRPAANQMLPEVRLRSEVDSEGSAEGHFRGNETFVS